MDANSTPEEVWTTSSLAVDGKSWKMSWLPTLSVSRDAVLEKKYRQKRSGLGSSSRYASHPSLRDPISSLCPGVSALSGPHCKASFKRLNTASTCILGAWQIILGSELCKCFPSPLFSRLIESVWRWLGWVCKAPLLFVGSRLCGCSSEIVL